MKTQVTCDDVFEILTRGPFPSGREEDPAVERHLAGCHDCRRLADALRPAVALFHEVLVDHEGEQLPEYRGSLPAQERLPALNRLAADLVHGGGRRKPSTREENVQLANGMRLACAMLLGVALCLVAWSVGTFVNQTQQMLAGKSSPSFTAANVHITSRTQLTLAHLSLPSDCWPGKSAAGMPATSAKHVCCTGCHAAAHSTQAECHLTWNVSCEKCHAAGPPTRLRTRDVAIAQQTCQACHDG
jgi:hypothetical protein